MATAVSTLKDSEQIEALVKRVKRAQGQLGAVARMLEEGKNCEEIIVQMSAASKAINTAAINLLTSSLEQCVLEGKDLRKTDKLQKLFLSLA